jgi:uncharacterized lipoprotein
MRTAGFAIGSILLVMAAGCAPSPTPEGIISHDTSRAAAVAAIVDVLSGHGYTIAQADEGTGTVTTDWLTDPAAEDAGTQTRYTATVTEERVRLRLHTRRPVEGEVRPVDSGVVDPKILAEIAEILGGETMLDQPEQVLPKEETPVKEDPGDGF